MQGELEDALTTRAARARSSCTRRRPHRRRRARARAGRELRAPPARCRARALAPALAGLLPPDVAVRELAEVGRRLPRAALGAWSGATRTGCSTRRRRCAAPGVVAVDAPRPAALTARVRGRARASTTSARSPGSGPRRARRARTLPRARARVPPWEGRRAASTSPRTASCITWCATSSARRVAISRGRIAAGGDGRRSWRRATAASPGRPRRRRVCASSRCVYPAHCAPDRRGRRRLGKGGRMRLVAPCAAGARRLASAPARRRRTAAPARRARRGRGRHRASRRNAIVTAAERGEPGGGLDLGERARRGRARPTRSCRSSRTSSSTASTRRPSTARSVPGLGSGVIVDRRRHGAHQRARRARRRADQGDADRRPHSCRRRCSARARSTTWRCSRSRRERPAGGDRSATRDDLMVGEWAIAIGNPFGFLLNDTAARR